MEFCTGGYGKVEIDIARADSLGSIPVYTLNMLKAEIRKLKAEVKQLRTVGVFEKPRRFPKGYYKWVDYLPEEEAWDALKADYDREEKDEEIRTTGNFPGPLCIYKGKGKGWGVERGDPTQSNPLKG